MKNTAGCLVLFLAAAAISSLLFPIVALGAEGTSFYSLPPATHARWITSGPDGDLWFSDPGILTGAVKIGRVDQAGKASVLTVPPRRTVGQITAGPDGNLWFTEQYSNRREYLVARIGRVSPAGEYAEYSLGNHVGRVSSITLGPDDAVWFTTTYSVHGHRGRAAVGRISVSGEVSRFRLPPHSLPGSIVAGPDGNLWFTDTSHGAPSIARITKGGQVSQFPLPDPRREPNSITVGPDGNLWFGESLTNYPKHPTNKIGRITTTGSITEFRVPGTYRTSKVTAGPYGDIWFATETSDIFFKVDSITPNGVPGTPTCLQGRSCELVPDALTAGPDGALWFSASKFYPHRGGGGSGIMESQEEEQESGYVGRLVPPAQTIARES